MDQLFEQIGRIIVYTPFIMFTRVMCRCKCNFFYMMTYSRKHTIVEHRLKLFMMDRGFMYREEPKGMTYYLCTRYIFHN